MIESLFCNTCRSHPDDLEGSTCNCASCDNPCTQTIIGVLAGDYSQFLHYSRGELVRYRCIYLSDKKSVVTGHYHRVIGVGTWYENPHAEALYQEATQRAQRLWKSVDKYNLAANM